MTYHWLYIPSFMWATWVCILLRSQLSYKKWIKACMPNRHEMLTICTTAAIKSVLSLHLFNALYSPATSMGCRLFQNSILCTAYTSYLSAMIQNLLLEQMVPHTQLRTCVHKCMNRYSVVPNDVWLCAHWVEMAKLCAHWVQCVCTHACNQCTHCGGRMSALCTHLDECGMSGMSAVCTMCASRVHWVYIPVLTAFYYTHGIRIPQIWM